MCLENSDYMANLVVSASLIASFLTFTSLLWLFSNSSEAGLVLMSGALVGTVCSLDLSQSRLKTLTVMTTVAFLNYDLAIYMDNDACKLLALAIIGLSLGPVFPVAYETGYRLSKHQGVGEPMSCCLINTAALAVSAFQHFVVLGWKDDSLMVLKLGMGLIHATLLFACVSLYITRKLSLDFK